MKKLLVVLLALGFLAMTAPGFIGGTGARFCAVAEDKAASLATDLKEFVVFSDKNAKGNHYIFLLVGWVILVISN